MDDIRAEPGLASPTSRGYPSHPSPSGDISSSAHIEQRHPPANDTEPTATPSLPEESTIRPSAPGPTLTPFYTVISDVTPSSPSANTYYPRVRYVFSDDDPDIISGALSSYPEPAAQKPETPIAHPGSAPSAGSRSSNNRSILLDLAPAADGRGYDVAWASSLAADWAVVGTRLHPLDSASNSGIINDEGGRSIVLDIEGLSIPAATTSSEDMPERQRAFVAQDGRKVASRGNDYDDLVRSFEMRMALLKSAVQNSEERRRSGSALEP